MGVVVAVRLYVRPGAAAAATSEVVAKRTTVRGCILTIGKVPELQRTDRQIEKKG